MFPKKPDQILTPSLISNGFKQSPIFSFSNKYYFWFHTIVLKNKQKYLQVLLQQHMNSVPLNSMPGQYTA